MLAGSQAQGFSERRPFPGKAQVELRPESCLPRSPGDPTIHLAEQNVTRMLITPRAGVALPCHGQSPDRCSGRGGHCRAPPSPGNAAAGSRWRRGFVLIRLAVLQPKPAGGCGVGMSKGGGRPGGGRFCCSPHPSTPVPAGGRDLACRTACAVWKPSGGRQPRTGETAPPAAPAAPRGTDGVSSKPTAVLLFLSSSAP